MTNATVLSQLRSHLREQGFRSAGSMFFRKTNGKEDIFSIAFSNYGTLHKARATAGVGITAIQDVVRFQKGLYHNAPEHTMSLAVGGHEYQFQTTEPASVSDCISNLLNDFRTIATPFFDRYRTVTDVDSAINVVGGAFSIGQGDVVLNCCTGIAAAYLSGSSNTAELVLKYRELVKQWAKGFYVPAFDDLVQKLDGVAQQRLPSDETATSTSSAR